MKQDKTGVWMTAFNEADIDKDGFIIITEMKGLVDKLFPAAKPTEV